MSIKKTQACACVSNKYMLNNQNPDQFRYNMHTYVAEAGVEQTVFSIKSAEKETDAAVNEEATEYDHRSNSDRHDRGRKMTCGKEESRNDICGNKMSVSGR